MNCRYATSTASATVQRWGKIPLAQVPMFMRETFLTKNLSKFYVDRLTIGVARWFY